MSRKPLFQKTVFLAAIFMAGLLAISACAPAVTPTPKTPGQAALGQASTPTSIPTAVPTAIPTVTPTEAPSVFTLSSPAFANGESIPKIYTCGGEGISPELTWNEPPAGTQSFALIFDDPDANGFTHWIIYNIPADRRGLPEDIKRDRELEDGIFQGMNGMAGFGYMGSCPPALHH